MIFITEAAHRSRMIGVEKRVIFRAFTGQGNANMGSLSMEIGHRDYL